MVEMITSVQNPLVKQLAGLKEKKGRDGTGLFLIEGIRFVEEALEAAAEVVQVVYSPKLEGNPRGASLLERARLHRASVLSVSDKVLAHIADTDSPQGIVAAVRIAAQFPEKLQSPTPLFLVADGIQDPGNLGTMIRTALAAGVDAVICTKGSVDIYNPKTLRSTMGAIFKIPCRQGLDPEELLGWLEMNKIPLAVADAEGEAVYYETKLARPVAILVGSEANGPCDLLRDNARQRIRIPLLNQVESLNAAVAAALLLFESNRQGTVIA
ncbi:MAG TPA: RNA methyltransferase [Verrucomicrobiae bacterium]|nr:RNA methyltransferase [Verrucomicrobiae bacterium]